MLIALVRKEQAERDYWRSVLERVAETIRHLAVRGLAFRGTAPSSPVTTTPSDDEDMSFNDNDELHEHDQTMEFENNDAMKLESPEVRMYKLILENKLETVFPNIEVALRIYLNLIALAKDIFQYCVT